MPDNTFNHDDLFALMCRSVISPYALADRCGIRRQAVSSVLTGEFPHLGEAAAARIARAFPGYDGPRDRDLADITAAAFRRIIWSKSVDVNIAFDEAFEASQVTLSWLNDMDPRQKAWLVARMTPDAIAAMSKEDLAAEADKWTPIEQAAARRRRRVGAR